MCLSLHYNRRQTKLVSMAWWYGHGALSFCRIVMETQTKAIKMHKKGMGY